MRNFHTPILVVHLHDTPRARSTLKRSGEPQGRNLARRPQKKTGHASL